MDVGAFAPVCEATIIPWQEYEDGFMCSRFACADWASFFSCWLCIKIEHLNRRTLNRMKFTVHEKQVKAQLGVAYDLSKYTEGVDYRRQKTGFGSRVVFRADILGLNASHSDLNGNHIALSVVDPSLVEHKQDMKPIIVVKDDFKSHDVPIITRPAVLDGSVRAARVVKKHQNQRFVETDTLGRVFVGEKGHQIKVNQIINVRDGVLYLSKLPNY